MTNHTHEVEVNEVVAAEVETKGKRIRRQFPKHQATAGDIIAELEGLKLAVEELEPAVEGLEGTAFEIVNESLQAKKKAYHEALNRIYHFDK